MLMLQPLSCPEEHFDVVEGAHTSSRHYLFEQKGDSKINK